MDNTTRATTTSTTVLGNLLLQNTTASIKASTVHVQHTDFKVPYEVSAFLVAVGCCVILLFIFFLYLNKVFCFRSCPAITELISEGKKQSLARLNGYSNDSTVAVTRPHGDYDDNTSSDSDDEVLRHYEQAVRLSRPNSQYGLAEASTAGLQQQQSVADAPRRSANAKNGAVPRQTESGRRTSTGAGGTTASSSSKKTGRSQSGGAGGSSAEATKLLKHDSDSRQHAVDVKVKGGATGGRLHNGLASQAVDCDFVDEIHRGVQSTNDDSTGRRPILLSSREFVSYGGLNETTQRDRTPASSISASSSSVANTAFDNPAFMATHDDCSSPVSAGGDVLSLAQPRSRDISESSQSPVSATGATVVSSSHQSTPAAAAGAAATNSDTQPQQQQRQQLTTASPMFTLGATDQDDAHLFDVGDLQDQEPTVVSKCGSLRVTFHYQVTSAQSSSGRMSVTINEARDIPTKDRGGAQYAQVHVLLLPNRTNRHRTKIRPTGDEDNPQFDETFVFKLPTDDFGSMGLRLRLYGCQRLRRERLIGEAVVGFAMLVGATESPVEHWLTLEPRSNLSHGDSKADIISLSRSDSGSSCQSMGLQHGGMPELMIGLAYNDVTGRLAVQVIKGSNFKNMAMTRPPDTYVKLTLMGRGGQEISRSKTSVRRLQPNPLYKETFMFQVAWFQLADVTLMVSVFYNRTIKRKEMIGWFSLGFSNSSDDEASHWTEMRESKGEEICRWHSLLEP